MSDSKTNQPGYEEYYLRVNPPTEANYRRKARGYQRRFDRLLSGCPVSSCLDLGCGTGMFASYLVNRGCEDVVGVDLNSALIETAQKHVEATFVVDDALHYTATCGRTFDAIFLLDLLEHIERDQVVELLTHVHAALSPGGFALVRVPNMNCIHAAGMFLGDWTHITPFTERSLEHVALRAGFTSVEHCAQFHMQNFKGKIKACINTLLGRALVWLRGGHKVSVFYKNLIVRLHK
jgi:2-polyprenyl-3-methyl-5-hydroxy-6-metoxy-1,4-benzoquinol methylase